MRGGPDLGLRVREAHKSELPEEGAPTNAVGGKSLRLDQSHWSQVLSLPDHDECSPDVGTRSGAWLKRSRGWSKIA